jgi:hypothetical protein
MQFQVRDTGSGIPAACLAQIFEPLYTTPEREARVNRLKMKDQYLSHSQTLLVFRAFLTPSQAAQCQAGMSSHFYLA